MFYPCLHENQHHFHPQWPAEVSNVLTKNDMKISAVSHNIYRDNLARGLPFCWELVLLWTPLRGGVLRRKLNTGSKGQTSSRAAGTRRINSSVSVWGRWRHNFAGKGGLSILPCRRVTLKVRVPTKSYSSEIFVYVSYNTICLFHIRQNKDRILTLN